MINEEPKTDKQKLYDVLSNEYDLGTYEEFERNIGDSIKRKKLFDAASADYDLGDYENYSQRIGPTHKESLDAFNAEFGSFLNDFEERDTAETKMSRAGMSSGIIVPMEGSITGEERQRYQELHKQEEALKKAWYTSDEYLAQKDAEAFQLAQMRKDIDSGRLAYAQAHPMVEGYNPSATRGAEADKELSMYETASRIMDDTIKLHNAPSRYDGTNAWQNVRKFGKGAGDTFSDVDFWTMGLTEIADNFGVREVLATVQDKLGNLNDLSEESIENILTPAEKAVLQAWAINAQEQLNRQGDLSRGYQAGQGAAESLGFMAEFMLTGGIGKAAAEGVEQMTKWLAKKTLTSKVVGMADEAAEAVLKNMAEKTASSAVRRYGKNLGLSLAEAAGRTGVMPSTFRNISEKATEIRTDEEGNNYLVGMNNAFASGLADSFIETLSEGGRVGALGELFGDVAGRIPFYKRMVDKLSNSKAGELWDMFQSSGVMNTLRAGGWHGIGEEYLEEWYGNALRTLTGVDKEALKEFATWDNQLVTVTSFLPLTIFGGTVSTAQVLSAQRGLDKKAAALRSALIDRGYDEAQADNYIDIMKGASPAEISSLLSPIATTVAGRSEMDARALVKPFMDFAMAVRKWQSFDTKYKYQEQEQRDALQQQMEGTLGKFWQEDETGARRVQRAVNAQGEAVYLLGKQGAADAEAGIPASVPAVTADGRKMFVNPSEYRLEDELDMNTFLGLEVMAEKGNTERARMLADQERNIQQIRQMSAPGTQINLGTAEAPVIATVAQRHPDGVIVTTPDGMARQLTYEELGNYLGINATPLTDAQLDEQEADALLAEQSQREAELDLEYGYDEDSAVEIAEAEEEIVQSAEAVTELPMDSQGNVDETALWNEDPARWAAWNDEQRQDGGANSVTAINAAMTNLSGQIAEQEAAYAAMPVGTERNDLEKQINANKARLSQLVSLQQGYAAQAEAALQAAAQEQAALSASQAQMTEQQMDEMDAQYEGIYSQTRSLNERARLLQEYLDKISVGTVPVVVLTKSNYAQAMKDAGCPDYLIRQVGNAFAKNGIIEGFMAAGKAFIVAESIPTIDRGRQKYVHERQHVLVRGTDYVSRILATGVTREQLKEYVRTFSGTRFYDNYGEDVLADELLSFAMELVYTYEDFSVALQKLGLSEDLINVIKSIDDEQSRTRNDERLSQARRRRRSNYNDGAAPEGGSRQDDRDLGQVSSGLLGQQDDGSLGYSQRGAGDREGGEGAAEPAVDDEINPAFVEAISTDAEDAEWSQAMDDKAFATPPAVDGIEADDVRHSIALEGQMRESTQAYYDKHYKGGKLSKTDQKRVPLNLTHFTQELLDTANAMIEEMRQYMLPYLDMESKGKRFLPAEVYGQSTLFDNASYGKTMENTLICTRTLAYIDFVEEVKKRIGRPLTATESFLASQMLYDIAIDPQCLYCYVSLDRKAYDEFLLRYAQQRDEVIAKWNASDKSEEAKEAIYKEFLDGRKPTAQMKARFESWLLVAEGNDAITLEDLATKARRGQLRMADMPEAWAKASQKYKKLKKDKKLEYAASEEYQNALWGFLASPAGQVADAEAYAQSASWAKKEEDYRSYTGELLKCSADALKGLMGHYGLRFYSFSEYSPAFILENMQMVRDAAARGLKGFAYTKEIDFIRIFAPTGMNINCSVYGRVDSEGNVVPDTKQGADWAQVQELREQYPNVGAVFVATNDSMVEWALNQPWIDVIIPFHIVRTGADIAKFYEWTNYSSMQSDTTNEGKSGYVYPHEHLNDKETFLRITAERGWKPRFEDVKLSDGRSIVEHPNYMRLVNETRRRADETPILTPVFNLEAAKDSFDRFVEKGGYYSGYFVEDGAFEEGIETVVEDIKAGKTAKEVNYGRQDVPIDVAKIMAKRAELERKHRRNPDMLEYAQESLALHEAQQAAEGVKFSIAETPEEWDKLAKKAEDEHGYVIPGLYDQLFPVIKIPYHTFEGKNRSETLKNAQEWAESLKGERTGMIDGREVKLYFSNSAVGKLASNAAINRSKAIGGYTGGHLAVIENIFKVLSGSVDVEIHPNIIKKKGVGRRWENGFQEGVICHRYYSAVEIDGDQYRAMIMVKEERPSEESHLVTPYVVEVQAFELEKLPDVSVSRDSRTSNWRNASESYILGAKLLKGVEKSYDPGVKVLDVDYFRAIEAGDMETAQRMVLEAAKLAMPNTKVVDENGNPKVVYHGGSSTFTKFDTSLGDGMTDLGQGSYFSSNEELARKYTVPNGDNQWQIDSYIEEHPYLREMARTQLGLAEAERIAIREVFRNAKVYPVLLNMENPYYTTIGDFASGEFAHLYNRAGLRGYDGIIDDTFKDRFEDFANGAVQYVAFAPSQIKSAEPVTYDDAGNVIPLSQRFNPANEDIRFSARTDEARTALFDAAKKEFGTTNNFAVAGYMLPDGTLLDFSEEGAPTNMRTLDHREIEGVIMEEGKEYDNRWEYLADFMNEGAIRLLPEYAGINLMKAPTKEQRDRLFDFIYKYNGEVILEIADERLNNVAYVEYDRRTSPSRIFRDIDGYFNEGIVPQQDTRFSVANESQAIFVSNAARAVEGIKMEKATPEQWLAMIEKNSGLKAGEDKWMGLSEWLKASNKKTLTKQEVLDFIGEHMIQIEEQHYSSEGVRQEADRILNENYPGWEEAFSFDWDPFMEEPHSDIYNEIKAARLYNETHEDQVETDEDGDIASDADYNKVEEFGAELAGIWYGRGRENTVREINGIREEYTTNGLTNLHEIALTVPTIESWKESDEVHFGDAGDGRAVAWIRFGETEITEEGSLMEYEPKNDVEREIKDYIVMGMNRWGYTFEECVGYAYNQITDAPQESVGWTEEAVTAVAEGMRGKARKRKVLVIDEIQSKRHQEGRERGYMPNLEKEYEQKEAIFLDAQDAYINYLKETYNVSPGTASQSKIESLRAKDAKLQDLWEVMQDANGDLKDVGRRQALQLSDARSVPDAPFDKNWHELAMKRMLRYAAEEGYDVIAWTKGEQQAERYNIGKVISGIHKGQPTEKGYQRFEINSYTPSAPRFIFTDNEGKIVDAMDNDGEEIQDYVGKNLSEVFGKDLAIKMLGAEENTRISHDEMRVGGEGMKGFYDRMLPAFMNKYGKKWGIKVEDIDLSHLQSDLTMHSVPVTEEMKASVMEGQVMFSAVQIDPAVRQEMDTIKAKAMWNGTFMKAPNGAETKLTEDQWLLVRTKNFINWFGDWINDPENAGVLLDENGEPKVVYHGTDAVFNTFDSAENDRDYKGFYFTDSQEMAQSYGQLLKPVFVRLPNAYVVDGGGRNWNMLHKDLFDIITDIEEQITAHEAAMSNWLSRGLVSQKQFDHFKDAYYDKVNFIKDESKNSIVDIIKKYVYRWQIRNFKSQLNVNRTRDVEWFIQQVNPEANIIFKDITDYGGRPTEFTGAHDVYVTTKANNIKSATETTGLFSESEDIRYSSRFDVNTNPTEAQKKAGNYKMGHLRLDGYNITIENPKGSVRRGIDSKGNEWENTLNNDYGYIRGTEGVDGDHIDVYLSDNPAEGNVFVIDQVNPETREFDEHKVMYGFNSMDEAREAYLANFSEGWNGLGTITEVTKDEFRKWIDSSHRKTKPFSEYKSVKTDILDEGDIRYSVVTDPALLERLDSEPTIKVYRAMQLIDGKLYPPMSAKVDGKMREPIELGKWEQAEERPDLADEKGYFKLDKGNKTSLKARYNPYFHTSPTPLNDQFSSAQTRPELVIVEVEVPESELTSGYKAEKAKDSVGQMEWKAGVVQGKLSGTRTVILSRWDKPIRIVPDSEVADKIVEMFDGKDITMPSNVVTPSLRAELESRGIPFVETDNRGKPVEADTRYSVLSTPTDEIVAEGMKFSIQDFARLAGNIFQDMPELFRKEAIEETFKRGWDMQSAIFQIPARLAEKENWDETDKDLAKVIREKVQDAMDESGVVMSRPLTTKEALWMLYRSTGANTDSMLDAAKRSLVAYNLGFDKETLALENEAREAVRFSAMRDATVNAKASMYNRGAVNVMTRLKESFVDMNASVEELVSAIEARSGKKAKGFENILMALNQQSSKGLAAMESYEMQFLNPMFDEIRKIMNETDFTYEDIVRYVILKHGLERNEKLAQRDARSYYQEIYDDIIDKIRSMNAAQKRTYLTNAQLRDADAKAELARLQSVDTSAMSADEKREHKKAVAKAQTAVNEAAEHLERAQKIASMSEKEAEDELQMRFDAIAAQADSKYNELRKNDYSGITSMFYDQLGVNRSDYVTEEEYQAALMDAKKHKYDTLGDVEGAADMEVKLFEGAADTKGLWKRINAATKETLRQQYEANMISKEQYDNLRGMFEYYVPLRGFKDNTAEDMYTYYRRPNSTGYTKPILAAEGRKTEAESPFGWIASMAGSAIASNVKNEAKLALYYFVSNRPENGIATVSKTWYVHTPGDVDDNGKRIFRPAYPTFSEDLSTEEAKDRLEQWQEQMRELKKQGLAYESGQKLNLGNAVVNISEANKPEHIVNVKVAGKDYTIIINGNPRAAQAINGDLNIEATAQDYSAVFGPILRWMSSVNTSYNPEFWITNMMRDMAFTWMAVNTKESPEYRRKFGENYRKAFSVIRMVAKNEKGTLGDSYLEKMYKEFVEYGGVTGYTQIKDNETWEKEIEKYLSSNDPESIRSGKVMRGVKNVFHAAHRFGESLEQVSRFAAFLTSREMGKPMAEAVNDAKEITVNFNRKGSGKMISLEEAKHLTGRNGKPLSKFWQWVAVAASSISPLGRRFIMFFNAAIQGLNATYKLYKANPKRMVGWTLAYAAVGAMNAVLHAFMDDDDDYLDMPQYERRNSLMIGGGGVYLKWALPQEARAFYALGDIAVESIMGRNPHQNMAEEVGKVFAELLPINPAEGWKAFLPSIAVPAFELLLNEDYKGDPIYNEMKWLTKEERERTAKWSNAKKGTGKTWVLISQGLNNLTGGDMYDAGLINIQPEKMEHLVQSAFGGTIRTADKFITTVIAMIDPEEEWTAKQTPFLNRILTINDERFRNVHVNDVFDFYRAEAEHAISLEKKYTKAKDSKALRELRSRDEYKWAKIYARHRKALENINNKLRESDGTQEKKELMKRQDELKKKMIKEFSSAR